MAKRFATETAAILEVSKRLNSIYEEHYQLTRDLLIRIVMMLTKMAKKNRLDGARAGSGSSN